jgi:HlyD family secretion protein
VNVVLELDTPRAQWASLGDGYRVEVKLVLWEGEQRLLAPASAVFRRDGGYAVFRVEDGRARLTPVRIGRRNDESIEVLSGVAEGAKVIIHPSDRVNDQGAVTAR